MSFIHRMSQRFGQTYFGKIIISYGTFITDVSKSKVLLVIFCHSCRSGPCYTVAQSPDYNITATEHLTGVLIRDKSRRWEKPSFVSFVHLDLKEFYFSYSTPNGV